MSGTGKYGYRKSTTMSNFKSQLYYWTHMLDEAFCETTNLNEAWEPYKVIPITSYKKFHEMFGEEATAKTAKPLPWKYANVDWYYYQEVQNYKNFFFVLAHPYWKTY